MFLQVECVQVVVCQPCRIAIFLPNFCHFDFPPGAYGCREVPIYIESVYGSHLYGSWPDCGCIIRGPPSIIAIHEKCPQATVPQGSFSKCYPTITYEFTVWSRLHLSYVYSQFKTAFLLAIVSAKCFEELHALSTHPSCLTLAEDGTKALLS